MIKTPNLTSINPNDNYLIHDLDDSIPGVCYRTKPKGWMDQSLFAKYFVESRAFKSNVHSRPKVIWVNNCTGYNMTRYLRMF